MVPRSQIVADRRRRAMDRVRGDRQFDRQGEETGDDHSHRCAGVMKAVCPASADA